ncbi:MAG: hypothetical protein VX561_07055 [Pseudomonadota bacterium]|mgnify:CR=1 FL=1|jgi:hypothetical protein|uniref:Uncharacterized protein n=1 Tax=Brevundimonas nasdae TaxID=172043 RepID=A0ACD4VPA3_9CAUL|nr:MULTISPECIES: hypothetical protein [Brevundimonas]MEA3474750.1 hypothetical protein [Pseudomonadota bacterium]MEE2849607.1 hypothetical protein [Pseudomonadota bacterium]WOB77910.1 hypothetical protein PZA08_11295 [Brevundimonas nasdae]
MTKADKVLWGLTAVILSLFVVVEAKTMMLNLGAAMHDAYCQDH